MDRMTWWLWLGTGLILTGMTVYLVGKQFALSGEKQFRSWAPAIEDWGLFLIWVGMAWITPPHWWQLGIIIALGWLYCGWRILSSLPRVAELAWADYVGLLLIWPGRRWLPWVRQQMAATRRR